MYCMSPSINILYVYKIPSEFYLGFAMVSAKRRSHCIVSPRGTERSVAGDVLPASYLWSGLFLRHEME
jgi:hypothetical protein